MKKMYFLFLLLALSPIAVLAQVAPLVSVEVAPPATICDPTGTTPLTATIVNPPNQTTSYTPLPVDPVYNPSFPTTGGTLLDATQDDVWSPVVTLPFTFSFYGNFYNQLIVGSNGLISFDTSDANGYCPWAFTATVPSPALPTNAIFGIYQDTNIASPPVTNPAVQNVNYYVLDTGVNQAPNRVFVVNFNQLPQFSCNNGVGLQTSQIVLYESSNVVDFFVTDRTCCPGWNSGSGVIGMQNSTGTVGHLAGSDPSNNTGCWSMVDTHYQIPPSGPPVASSLQWYQGGTPVNNGIPTGGTPVFAPNQNTINVGPGTYTAVVTFTYPNGTSFTVSDTQTVSVLVLDVADPLDIAICDPTQTAPYTVNINQNNHIAAGSASDPDPTHYAFSYYLTQTAAINGSTTNDINTPNAFVTSGPFPQSIFVRIEDLVSTGCVNVREFLITEGPSGAIAYPGDPTGLTSPQPGQYCSNLTGNYNVNATNLTAGGTYTVTSANPATATLTIDPATGAITPGTSDVGVYTVTYGIAASPPCPAFTTTATVEIVACNCSANVSSPEDQALCVGDAIVAIDYSTPGATSATVSPALPPGLMGQFFPATETYQVTGNVTTAGNYTYTVTLNVTPTDFCTETTNITVSANSTVTLNAGSNDNQTLCVGSPIANIFYTIDATATGVAVNNLPAGVNYSISGNLLTISGTPTAVPASPTYDITFSGCNPAPVTGNINVQAAPVVTLVSGNDSQTPCVNAPITNIVYSYSGSASGLNVTGLPAGVTFAAGPGANEITISGTPNTVANSNYSVETISPCPVNPLLSGTINVNPLPTITGASSLCLGATTTLTGSGTPSATTPWTSSNPAIASVDATGLVTANAAGGPVTITYTNSNNCSITSTITVNPLPTITGTFTLCAAASVTLTGSGTPATANAWSSDAPAIATVDATGTVMGVAGGTANITYTDANGCTATQLITVIAAPTISGTFSVCAGLTTALTASAAPATANPWTSSNTAVATVDALGVVSGVTAGTTTITFTDANGCQGQQVVTVIALPTVSGNTALADICINTVLPAQTYTFGGSATGLAIDPTTPLPAGLSFAAGTGNSYVLSGTPSVDGSYSFDIITVGGCTPLDRITVSITVKPDATLTLTGNDNQTVCINSPISPITLTVGGGATNVIISSGAMPTGVTLAPSGAGAFTISGSPGQVGQFNFNISTVTAHGCIEATVSVRIEINQAASIQLTSNAGTTNQPACQGLAISPITYVPGNGATQIGVTGLPAGITGNMDPLTGVFTISGSSSVIGSHTYVVSTLDGCAPMASLSGIITITPSSSISLTSAPGTDSQRLCTTQEALTNIVFTVADGATGAFIVTGQVPVGISGVYDPLTKTFTISGTPTQAGTFDFTVRTTGGCGFSDAIGRIVVDPLPVITLPTDESICIDSSGNPVPGSDALLTTGLPQANHIFEWSDSNGIIAGATGNNYLATAPGVYSVKVTNTLTGCYESQSTTINSSLPPLSVTATASAYFSQEQVVTIVALPIGNYEYQVDNGAWQDSNNFFNLPSGEHKFLVRDKAGCGTLDTSIIIIDYPRFFTPNNDGYNDTWNISDLNLLGNQSTSKIEIFDRYGKLLKSISPLGTGWDGMLNGKMLPATDYWFKVNYTDELGLPKEFKAHFSLKR